VRRRGRLIFHNVQAGHDATGCEQNRGAAGVGCLSHVDESVINGAGLPSTYSFQVGASVLA